MIKKSLVLLGVMTIGFASFSQTQKSDSLRSEGKVVKQDSLLSNSEFVKPKIKGFNRASLRDYVTSRRIDSLWQKELTNSDLYPKIQKEVLEIPFETDEVAVKDFQSLPTDTLKKRLAELNRKTPFQVQYHPELESAINRYLGHSKKSYERLMSLSLYYFPLFERELDKYNIPLELKYLAVIESALNPQAKSPVGATGLWQFMYATGKMHNLTVSSYVDERMDPVKSTQAAAEYLSELYKIFGDWNLVLAAYNAGPGNVSKAIRRSGGESDYWKLKRFLPRETANYIPAFMATMYLFEYADEHGFTPYMPEVVHFQTDTIQIKNTLKFDHIVKITGADEELIRFLNPEYKLNVIPAVKGKKFNLRLPVQEAGLFAANEKVVYKKSEELLAGEKLPRYEVSQSRINYRVKSGDFLGKIAKQYGVSITNLRNWNRLPNNNIRAGQNLVIYPRGGQVAASPAKNTSTKTKPNSSYYVVQPGDSIWRIANKLNGVTVSQIKKWNGISGSHLKPGMRLKVSEG